MANKATTKKVHPEELENARWGYQIATSSAILFAEQFWSIFNAMLVANSIVSAGISFVKSSESLNPFSLYLSIIGLVLCFVWFLLSRRHQEFAAYYILSAREIEERYFSNSVKTLSRGGDFGDGKSITLQLGQSETKRKLSFWARLENKVAASYLVILIFALIYIGAFFI